MIHKKIIKIIAIIVIAIMITTVTIKMVKATQIVELSLVPNPYIDVVLAKGKTQTNLTNFKTDLENSLEAEGIDKSKVNISSIESQTVNLQKAFQWEKDISSSIGSISITNNGQDVVMYGNPSNPGKIAIWIIPEKDREQTFSFSYDIDYGDSYNAAGMLLRVSRSGNNLTGYMLSFNNSSWVSSAGGTNGAIWKFTYPIGQNSTNFNNKTLVKSLSISKSGSLTVKASDEEIIVSGGGLSSPVKYTIPETTGAGFGFFSDHYSHGCDQIGHFKLSGINLKTIEVKKMEEVLREPTWREDSIKVLVNVSDVENEQLNATTSLGELLTRILNDEINYVAWGNSTNQSQTENFIVSNDNNGIFINNTSYTNSINQTATYIKSLIDAKKQSQYVILNEPTKMQANKDGIMTDTADEQYPYGKWKIVHDCEYYENNIGQFSKSNKYINNMITEFDKTGKYNIYYEDQAVLPNEIYVHRRPVAEVEVVRNSNTVNLKSLSYDLDEYSKNNGISEEEWKYRKVGETTWTEGKLTDITNGTDYLVQLRVKDYQGTWSVPISKYITKNLVQPIASFKIKNVNTSIYENIEIVDGSYDPSGGTITNREWTVYKEGTQIYTGTQPLLNYYNYGTGNYEMTLKVTSSTGQVSEAFKREFTIIPDDEAPEFVATPTSCSWSYSQDVQVTFSDRLGSGFKEYQYAITESQDEPTIWSQAIQSQEDTISVEEGGIKYIHIKAVDNAGNVSQTRVLGPYYIDREAPDGTIVNTPADWVIDQTVFDWSLTDSQSGFSKIVLPDGQESTNNTGKYTVTENGIYRFEAYDQIGNKRTITKQINNIDKVQPIISLEQKDTDWSDAQAIITWDCSDNESGFSRVLLPDGSTSQNRTGEYIAKYIGTYTFIAYDNVGNQRIEKIQIQNIDKTKPTLTLSKDIEDWVNADLTVMWNSADNESGFNRILLPNGSVSNETMGIFKVKQNGTYTFIAYDNVGNSTVETIKITNIDKIEPTINIEVIKSQNKIKWELEDGESGAKEMLLPNGEIVKAQNGEYDITNQAGKYVFVGFDNAGNMKIQETEVK